MTILEFILTFLSSMGIINIIIHSPLAELLRSVIIYIFNFFNKNKLGNYLISCPSCTGFWVGIFMLVVINLNLIWYTLPFAISFVAMICQIYWFPQNED